jgi:hypothetical protein
MGSSAFAQTPVDPARLVQRNITGALGMLAERDVSQLSPAQRSKRAWVAAELQRYRAAGEFPENRDFPGDNVPFFVDQSTGAVCAVGHLMVASGRRDLVDRIVAEDNNVWVLELAADAEVSAWLDEHGLTLSEAARIQIPYVSEPTPGPSVRSSAQMPQLTAVAGVATAGVLLNALAGPGRETRLRGVIGVTSGLLAIGYGVEAQRYRDSRGLGFATAAVGGMSLLASSTTFSRLARNERLRISPIVPTGRDEGAGLSFSLTF